MLPSCSFRRLLPRATLILLAMSASAVAAQEQFANSTDHEQALRECRAIADPEQRLACFDVSVSAMLDATSEGELRFVDQEEVRKVRRRLFGFSLPDLGIFGSEEDGGDEDELNLLHSSIARVMSVNRNTVVFEIDEGSVWQMNDVPPWLIRRMEAGTPVEFKRAALGSYFIRIDGQTGIKGRRVR